MYCLIVFGFASPIEQTIEQLPKTNKKCSIDLGLKDFVITSDGIKFKNNRYTKKYSRELKKAQQHLSRKELIEEYDLICIEDLNVKGMIKNHKLSKHIADASWGNFVNLLNYKCDWYGKELVKVNRFYPSSKTCNCCGWVNQELKLSDRKWTCKCGETHDRDINASKNILKECLKIYGKGLAITKVDRKSDFIDKAHSMKP